MTGPTTTRHRVLWALAALVLLSLVVLAASRDLAHPYASPEAISIDLVVGLAFVAAGAYSRSQAPARLFLAATGGAWLAASISPSWAGVHQGMLLLALGVIAGVPARAIAVLAVCALLLAAGEVAQYATGAAFLILAVLVFVLQLRRRRRAAPAAASALLIGGCLVARGWWADWSPESYDPAIALATYEGILLLVATGLTLGSRLGGPGSQVLADAGASSLEALNAVLARALGDPAVRVLRPGDPVPPGARVLDAAVDHETPARVAYGTAALDDRRTAAAVIDAVRLTLRRDALLNEQRGQLRALEEARSRIVEAADRQRSLAAGSLRDDVATLDRVRVTVDALVGHAAADDALVVAAAELREANSEILALVAGVPPVPLGGGHLRAALADLSTRVPIPVELDAGPGLSGSPEAETTAYFVAAEALTNAVKHAGGAGAVLRLRQVGRELEIEVADRGPGGADPMGRGLRGLAARVDAAGGRLRVESPAGAGTRVVARLPVS